MYINLKCTDFDMNGLSNKKKINDNNKEDGGGNLMEGEGRLSRLRPYLLLSNFSLSVFFLSLLSSPYYVLGFVNFAGFHSKWRLLRVNVCNG
jgi:hypothetical protein